MEHLIITTKEDQMINITETIKEEVKKSKVKDGIVVVYVPHTTAGITINESYDPDVVVDMLTAFKKIVPQDPNYLHLEGNSHSHVKASLVGSSITIIIKDEKLNLGRWQGVFFCEFDGPRRRTFSTKIIEQK